MTTVPALYQVEPTGIDGQPEANGIIYRFCDNGIFGFGSCRSRFLRNRRQPQETLVSGTDVDAINGTVCDECGKVLITE